MLDIVSFLYINRAGEDDLEPVVIMATNRGISRSRETHYNRHMVCWRICWIESLLSRRLLFSRGDPGDRAQEEEVELSPDALQILAKIGVETSIRYAANLIAVAHLAPAKRKANIVDLTEVKQSYTLILDKDRSVEYL
ncbi:TIP49 C-terminus-domain-containing protein [Lipomyces starkeyi]